MQHQEREEPKYESQLASNHEDGGTKLTSRNLNRIVQAVDSHKTASTGWEFLEMSRGEKNSVKSKESGTQSAQTAKTSSSTKSVSSSEARFPHLIRRNGILTRQESKKASNFNEIRETLKRPRASPSPEPEDFTNFCEEVRQAINERGVEAAFLPLMKKARLPEQKRHLDQQFTRFPPNVGFNDGLSAAKPDFVEGYPTAAFAPYPIGDRLGGSAVLVPDESAIALPHLVGEIKRYGGDLLCGRCQAAYDAACLVYGRNNACISMSKMDKANTAYVGSFITDGDRLSISVHYSAKDDSGKTLYHQCPLFDQSIHLDHETFKLGIRHMRNLQDWAKDNACSIKDDLIFHYLQQETLTKEGSLSDAQGGDTPGDGPGSNLSGTEAGANKDTSGT